MNKEEIKQIVSTWKNGRQLNKSDEGELIEFLIDSIYKSEDAIATITLDISKLKTEVSKDEM